MPEIKASEISLIVDGKNIGVKSPSKLNLELNKDLLDNTKFKQFSADPAGFAKNYDLDIHPDVSTALSAKLQNFSSLSDLHQFVQNFGGDGATAWAVASGSYSISSSKIAVAF